MSFVLEARHWVIMIGAVLLAAAALIIAPQVVVIYPVTTYAFPIIALGIIFDTLGTATERHRAALRRLSSAALVSAGLLALAPLLKPWEAVREAYSVHREAGQGILRSFAETRDYVSQFSGDLTQAITISLFVGLTCLGIAVLGPLLAYFDMQVRPDRISPTGPWRARWMPSRDIAQLAGNQNGLPLVQHNGKILRYVKNDTKGWRGGHHAVIAGTRGGKGVSAVIPAILEHNGPVVTLDVKGENFAVTRRHRATLGRKVVVLNPFGVSEDSKDQFNPMDYIRTNHVARDASVLADGLVKPEPGDGAHFSDMAKKLIAAAIEVVATQQEPERRNLVTVMDLLLAKNLEATLKAWTENRDLVGHRAAQAASTILGTGENERGSILSAISKAFDWMRFDEMRAFLEGSSFDLDDLIDNRVDLFIVVPLDQIKDQDVFMRLFVNLVLGTVVRQDGRRKVKAPILLMLDEFVRLGRMEQILNIANVAAGVGIEAVFVTQDVGQVEQVYGKYDARSIFGSCITKRIFNVNDVETAEWAARHLGDGTVYSQQRRESRTSGEGPELSYSEQSRKLMMPEQILGMASDEVLLLIGNHGPLRAKQNAYFNNEAYKAIYDQNPLL